MGVRLPPTRAAGQRSRLARKPPSPFGRAAPGESRGRRSSGGRPLALFLGLLLPLLSACGAGRPSPRAVGTPTMPPAALSADSRAWVESTLRDMDTARRAAQLVMVWMSGGYAPETDGELQRIRSLVEAGLGGIVISVGTPHAYVSRLNRLQAAAEVPLLVAADFEAGAGFRLGGAYALPSGIGLGGATELPPAMAFGAIGEEAVVHRAGHITALEARALGVHLNFAPVLDVNSDPDNPIINTRSFGEDPLRVAALGAAYIRGAHQGGLLSTAKHFPGHGDTETDSHVALPIVPGDRARLERIELVPFRRAIEAGVDAVMTAHVAVPGILGPDAPPATLSSAFMTDLLRGELGFDGVLFTDALDMGAIVETYGAGEAAVRALEAGADVLLMPANPAAAIEAVVEAVRTGRIAPERLESSVRRILALKARAGLDRGRLADQKSVPGIVGTAAHLAFADSVARRSVTLVRDLAWTLPIDAAETPRVLSLTFAREWDIMAGRTFDARLRGDHSVVSARLEPGAAPDRFAGIAARLDSIDLLIVSAYASPLTGLDPVRAPSGLESVLAAAELAGVPHVLISFGSPYLLSSLPDAAAYAVAWGGSPALQRAAAEAIAGEIPFAGRLPIALAPLYAVGHGRSRPRGERPSDRISASGPGAERTRASGLDPGRLARVDRILERAVLDSVAPGAALAVGRSEGRVRLSAYGSLDWSPGSPPVTDSTVYDLASLTKVLGTTTAIMLLVEEGRLELDDRVGSILDEWAAGRWGEVTIRDLLLHRGGLPPFRPLWREIAGRTAYREAIGALEPAYPPRSRTVYSDLGFMTLGFVVEELSGTTLDRYLEARVFRPLGLRDTGFRPDSGALARIAPTELDTVYRGRVVRGEVHDENAFALGGVAGHAGLFSSARDLATYARWLLRAARAGRHPAAGGDPAEVGDPTARADLPPGLPSPATVADFVRRAGPESTRALGWDTPSPRSSAGRFFTAVAFGHTGFTGTSVWIDPELDLFVVLLTNRVHPSRENLGHIPLRAAVHDAVAASVSDRAVRPRARPEPPDAGERR